MAGCLSFFNSHERVEVTISPASPRALINSAGESGFNSGASSGSS